MALPGRRPDLSLSERVDKLGALLRHLKALAARPALRRPAWRMLVARSLVYLLPGLGAGALALERYVIGGVLLAAWPLAVGLLLFYDVGQRGRMAYHVERWARDEPSDAAGASAAIDGKRGKLLLLGAVEWFERKLQADDADRGLVMKLIAGLIGEILDVAGAFLVPAVVLDDVTLEEAAERVTTLKDHAPEAFAASVGFDAVASLLRGFFWTPVVLIPIAAIGGTVAGLLTIPQAVGVVAVLALLVAVPLAALQALREAAKAVYFTALYLTVAHPDALAARRKGELEGLVGLDEGGKDGVERAEAGVA